MKKKNMNINISDHPLVLDKVSKIRDKKTSVRDFRHLMGEISMLLGYEALASVKLKNVVIKTPLADCRSRVVSQDIVFISILRAGLGMVDGLVELYPDAKIAHIGMYRNENTLTPVKYYFKVPRKVKSSFVLLADPMLATGGSAVEAVNMLKAKGADKIYFLCLIASKKGLDYFTSMHPDVPVFVAAVDEKLNKNGYIVPGLGDAGDRTFGTL